MIRLPVSRALLLPRGRFSSMLDMGGISPSGTSAAAKRLDVGKNCRVRSVALDFDLITRSIEAQKAREDGVSSSASAAEKEKKKGKLSPPIGHSSTVAADAGVVEKMANLLGVRLGSEMGRRREEDDLSGITGERTPSYSSPSYQESAPRDELGGSILDVLAKKKKGGRPAIESSWRDADSAAAAAASAAQTSPPFLDVRSKYADKLRRKLDGGLAGVDRAKSERDDASKKGDAAGHLAARRIASAQPVPSGSKWLATTGAANLLAYLTGRSLRVALLPVPGGGGDAGVSVPGEGGQGERMEELTRQLPHARFDLLLKDGTPPATSLLASVTDSTNVPPLGTLVVSDREDYLRAAKEGGMYTCRVRPPNAPRGNVSTSYTVASVGEVEDVLNELNGISYNTVFAGAGINHGGV